MNVAQENIVSKEDQVRVNFSSELMSNYFPESSIKGSKEIRTFMVGPDQPLIFYQDQDDLLKAILRKEGSESGWISFSLSEGAVKSYELEYNIKKGRIQLAKVESNQVWVSQALDVASTDFEKLEQALSWTALKADTFAETIDKVSLGTQHVLFGTSSESSDALFYLADLKELKPESYTFPEHAKTILQFELGTYAKFPGVFFLYQIGNERTLLFQSFPDEEYDRTYDARFVAEETLNCFALLELPSGNDLVYAAGNQIHQFKGPENGEQASYLTLPGVYQQVHQIRSASFEGENSVWALDQAGLYYQTNRFFNQGNQEFESGKWTSPLLMVEGVSQFSCVKGKGIRNQLYAISTTFGSELTRLWQDSVTTLWNTNRVTLSDLDSLKEVQTYSAQVRFNTDSKLTSFRGQKVYLSAESNVFVYVDNQSFHLGPDHQVAISLGLIPEFTIVCPVDEIGASTIQLTADFLPNAKVIDLSGKIFDQLQSKIEESGGLAKAKKQNGNSLVPTGVSAETIHAAQDGISKMLGVASAMGTGKTESVQSASFRVGTGVSLDSKPLATSDFGHSLGDFLHSVWNKAKEAFEFVIEKVADGVKFMIKIGEQVFNWIVKTIREIGGFIQRVFDSIKVFFKDLFEFLAFLFQWEDIIETKRAYKGFVNNAIEGLRNEIGSIRKFIDETLEAEIAKFDPHQVEVPDQLNQVNVTESPKESNPDPRANWLDSKKQFINQGKGGELKKKMPTEFSDVFEQFIQDLSPIFQETGTKLIDQIKLLEGEFSKLIKGETTFVDFLKFALDRLAVAGLTLLKALVDVILRALEALIEVAYVGMNKVWDIPIISALYKEVSGGDDLTFLDALCLLVAIPTTILFKIGEGKAPFDTDEVKDAFVKSGGKVFQLNLN